MGNLCSNSSRADDYKVAGGEGKVRQLLDLRTVCQGGNRWPLWSSIQEIVENEDAKAAGTSAVADLPLGAAKNGSAAASGKSGQIANYTGAKAKLDPKDFEFVGLKGEVKVKLPG